MAHTPDPPRSLHLWLLFRKLVSSYPRSTPGIEYIFGKYIWLNKPAVPRNFPVTFILMWNLPCQHRSFLKQRKRNLLNNFLGIFMLVSKAWIPMSLNFSLPVHVKFTCINEIKAMYDRPHVKLDLPYNVSSLFTRWRFTCVLTLKLCISGKPP